MRVIDIMSTPVHTIRPSETVENARDRMQSASCHHLVVVDGRQIVGVLSAGDIVRIEYDRLVGDVMSSPAATVEPTLPIRQAANRLRGRHIGCLPVVDGERLVGILTTLDLLEAIGKTGERPIDRSRRSILRNRGARFRPIPSAPDASK